VGNNLLQTSWLLSACAVPRMTSDKDKLIVILVNIRALTFPLEGVGVHRYASDHGKKCPRIVQHCYKESSIINGC
jgi:hypothetical protein